MDPIVRAKLNADLAKPEKGKRNMDVFTDAIHACVDALLEFRKDMQRVRGCKTSHPCNQSVCRSCSFCTVYTHFSEDELLPIWTHQTSGRQMPNGGKRNFKYTSAKSMWNHMEHFNFHEVHPVTINLSLQPADADFKAVINKERKRLRSIIARELREATATGLIDFAPKHADQVCLDYPKDGLAPCYHVRSQQSGLAFLVHIHMLIRAPKHKSKAIKKIFKRHYKGDSRVCVAKGKRLVLTPDDYEQAGLEGYAEYAAMEKYVVDQKSGDPSQDNVAAVQALARIRKSVSRTTRRFKIGKKSIAPPGMEHCLRRASKTPKPGHRRQKVLARNKRRLTGSTFLNGPRKSPGRKFGRRLACSNCATPIDPREFYGSRRKSKFSRSRQTKRAFSPARLQCDCCRYDVRSSSNPIHSLPNRFSHNFGVGANQDDCLFFDDTSQSAYLEWLESEHLQKQCHWDRLFDDAEVEFDISSYLDDLRCHIVGDGKWTSNRNLVSANARSNVPLLLQRFTTYFGIATVTNWSTPKIIGKPLVFMTSVKSAMMGLCGWGIPKKPP